MKYYEFSASLLQSSVSHDPSEIILIRWFDSQETFLIIINVKISCAAQYFCGNCDAFYFIHLWWIESKTKQHFFCNIMNVLTVN